MKEKFNISKETLSFLDENYSYGFYNDFFNESTIEKASILSIGFSKDGEYVGKTIKPLKKEITIEYIINKINFNSIYTNFSKSFNKLIELDGYNSYPTTYGIGIFVLFCRKTESIAKITAKLESLGIEYRNEYSDAGWVYRFRISQSKENINKINKFLAQ